MPERVVRSHNSRTSTYTALVTRREVLENRPCRYNAGVIRPDSDPLAPGRQVGKYEVVRRVATGGMAEIYLARVRGIERFEKYVVLKRILPQYARNDAFVRMFLNEARVAATLDHPNIATVYDIDQVDGVYFFTMEYLHGEDLGFLLQELRERAMAMPLEHAITIGVGVAAGLHAAHDKHGSDGKPLGIVHRDVSPQNVVVTFAGSVKLVDFGIAKVTSHPEFTGSGSLKGKFSYMSPEQCRNQPVDRRSDIFSLGVLLYEITTQTRLFKQDNDVDTIRSVMEAKVPPPSSRVSDYPPDLEAVVLKTLAQGPDARWATARDLQLALEAVAGARGLVVSTAALGEWMDGTFGPKVEPWRSPFGEVDPKQENIATRVVSAAQAAAPAERIVTVVPGSRRSSRVGRAKARAVVLAAGVAAGALLALWRLLPAPEGAAVPARIEVTAERGQVALDRTSVPPSVPSPAVASLPAPVAVPPPTEEAPTRARKERPARPARVDSASRFRVAFARKERELERCFADFPGEGLATGDLSVRFRADADGKVTSAEVLPEAVAGTPLGACVAKVASTTRFGQQGEPVQFRIPVSVRRLEESPKP